MNWLKRLGLRRTRDYDREPLSIYKKEVGKKKVVQGDGYEIVQFGKDGLDYETYVAVQTAANKAKIDWLSVQEENITFLCEKLKAENIPIKSVLCHGTRNGADQRFFKDSTGADVIGTEISETATQFPMTIQWDFHEVKPEWVQAFDVVFSNSWDHSYDPEKAFRAWLSCVRKGGVLVVEWSNKYDADHASPIDPFRASLSALLSMLDNAAKGEFAAPMIFDNLPKPGDGRRYVALRRN